MAYQNSGLLWTCGKCRDSFTYYKLCESQRLHTVDDTEKGTVNWRVCAGCELDLRREEFANWPGEMKTWHRADYPAEAAIKNQLKRRNKRSDVEQAGRPSNPRRRSPPRRG